MAYQYNFFIRTFAILLNDLIGPAIILLVYTNTSGIPGWSLYEFLLFQGTFTLVFGIGHVFFIMIPAEVIRHVRKGKFDTILLKPYNSLVYLTSIAFDWDGFGQLFAGLALVIFALIKLKISIFSLNFLAYILIILFALIFQYSIMILVSALTFLIVESWAIFDLVNRFTDFARYPTDVYSPGIRFFITFLFPVSICAFIPATILLKGINMILIIKIAIPVILFFFFSLYLWNLALRKYTSAGG